jgi:hypothetical protein
MVDAADDQQIQEFWASQIGDDQQRVDTLAAYLAKRTTPIIGSGTYRPPSGAPTAAPEPAGPVEESGQTTPPAAAVPPSPTIAQRSASIQAANLAKLAGMSPPGGVPRAPLFPKGAKQAAAALPRSLGTRAAAAGSRFSGAPAGDPPRPPTAPAATPELNTAPDVTPMADEHLPAPGGPVAADGPLPHDAPAPSEGAKDPES